MRQSANKNNKKTSTSYSQTNMFIYTAQPQNAAIEDIHKVHMFMALVVKTNNNTTTTTTNATHER